jgi:hypothetical protein
LSEDGSRSGTLLLAHEAAEAAPAVSREPIGKVRRPRVYTLRVVLSGLLLAAVALAAAAYLPAPLVGGVFALVSIVVICHRALLSWTGLLVALLCIILFIPVRRLKLPIPLPFALEPYRVIIVLLILAVVVSLLVDPRFSWRRTGFGPAFALLFCAFVLSIATNIEGLSASGRIGGATAALFNYAMLFSIFFLTRILLTSENRVKLVLRLLTIGGAFVGAMAAVERVTQVNIFLRLGPLLGLQRMSDPLELVRSGGARAYGSASHPIALSVLLAMLIPLAVYQAKHSGWPRSGGGRQLFWVGCGVLMGVGIICTVSRTSLVVLAVMSLVGVVARPALFKRLILIGIPAAALASLVAPGVVLIMIRGFTNPSSLIASQYSAAGFRGSGRLADLLPNLTAAMVHPFFGTGVGSRVVSGPGTNAQILDDQLLTTLLEVGMLGILGVLVLFWYPIFRLWRFSRSPSTPARFTDLAVALLTTMVGYFFSLFFFDGFGFTQTVMVFALLLAIGGWLVTEVPWTKKPRRKRAAVPAPAAPVDP